jgi:hypothetical protein
MDRLEQAQRAASIVVAAREFYTELKRTFPRRLELEEKVGPLAGLNRRWLENYKTVCAQVRAGRATKRDLLIAASNRAAHSGRASSAPATGSQDTAAHRRRIERPCP